MKRVQVFRRGLPPQQEEAADAYGVIVSELIDLQSSSIIATQHGVEPGIFVARPDGGVEYRHPHEKLVRRVASSLGQFFAQLRAAELVFNEARANAIPPRRHAGNLRRAIRGVDDAAFKTPESWWALIADLIGDDLFDFSGTD